ncbi:MAG TPA: BMP family ABC transporter substrate-binding protein [Chthonomonadaceae bacterium]|nr:BMP family ABC transporter substrate-binding protein [Chthonomonadaceae bacterium]
MRKMRLGRMLSALLLSAALAGCGGPKAPESGTPANGGAAGAPGGKSGGKPIRAALVLDTGGRDDKSFNAAAYEGIERAEKELGVEAHDLESKDASDYQSNLTRFASEGYDVVFAVGFAMEDALKAVAPQFPNVKFAIVDGNAPDAPNCAALQFREEQGSFLVGYLAGAMSKTKTIGFVGGLDIPLIHKFEAGYRAGAKTADPNVKVIAAYTGDWNDVNKGKSQAMQLIGNGADILYQAAGKAGLGAIQAAKEKGPGYYAIGVDRDQDDEAPGRVLTSMVKRVDNAVYDTIKRVKEGRFQPGVQLYDLKSDGVGLSAMKYTKQEVPAETLARLEKIKKMIADGQIVPPTTVEAVATFQPPKL